MPEGEGYFDAISGGHYTIDGRGRRVTVEGPAWDALDWVVAGGEIGAECAPDAAALGARAARQQRCERGAVLLPAMGRMGAGGRMDDRMVRVGKRAAGRLIDGRSWDQIPADRPAG